MPALVGEKNATREEMLGTHVFGRCIVGTRRVPVSTIRGALSTALGDPYEDARTQRDIERIYALDTIDDVQVTAAFANGGVRLRCLRDCTVRRDG